MPEPKAPVITRRSHNIQFLTVFCWVCSIIVATAGPRAALAAGKFVVGYAAMNARLAPLWLAEERGYFAKYGLESQAVFLRSATLLVTGLSSGDIHAGSGGGSAALSAVGAGYDVKIIGSFSTRNSYDLVARPSMVSLAAA